MCLSYEIIIVTILSDFTGDISIFVSDQNLNGTLLVQIIIVCCVFSSRIVQSQEKILFFTDLYLTKLVI